jgi:hypothetical protein
MMNVMTTSLSFKTMNSSRISSAPNQSLDKGQGGEGKASEKNVRS